MRCWTPHSIPRFPRCEGGKQGQVRADGVVGEMSTMSDNEPVDLEEFRRRRAMAAQAHNEACKQLSERTGQELCALWQPHPDEPHQSPDNPRQLLSVNAAFIVLFRNLLLLALIHR